MDIPSRQRTFDFFSCLVDKLEERSIPYWLEFGSLLGFARYNCMLSHDFDIDLGVWHEDRWKITKILSEIKHIGYRWTHAAWANNFCMWDIRPYKEDGNLSEINIDIYYYKKTYPATLAYPVVYAESRDSHWKNILFPFSDKCYYFENLIDGSFGAFPKHLRKVKVPKYYKEHLSHLYGNDYIENVRIKGLDYNDTDLASSKCLPEISTTTVEDTLSKHNIKDGKISIDFMNKNNLDYLTLGDMDDTDIGDGLLEPLSENRVIFT